MDAKKVHEAAERMVEQRGELVRAACARCNAMLAFKWPGGSDTHRVVCFRCDNVSTVAKADTTPHTHAANRRARRAAASKNRRANAR